MASSWEIAQFVKHLGESPSLASLSKEAREIVIAHAAYESGWGGTSQARQAFNLFNVTAGSRWTGPVVEGGDLEYSGGSVKRITQKWRVYDSMNAAVEDYLALLDAPHFKAHGVMDALLAGDVDRFLSALYAGKYFTLPVAEYARTFRGVLGLVKRVGV